MYVAVGGALGAVSRYLTISLLTLFITNPWATVAVNVIGCGLAGGVVGYWYESAWFQQQGRFLLLIGVLGGFTTYSAFSKDFFDLMANQKTMQALIYVAATLVMSLGAFWIGYRVFEHNA